jgi:hypothetical protein
VPEGLVDGSLARSAWEVVPSGSVSAAAGMIECIPHDRTCAKGFQNGIDARVKDPSHA